MSSDFKDVDSYRLPMSFWFHVIAMVPFGWMLGGAPVVGVHS